MEISQINDEEPIGTRGGDPPRTEIFRITINGLDQVFACRSDESVLAAMSRQCAGRLVVGCRRGGCGVCRVQVLSGRYRCGAMSRQHVGKAEQDAGFVLACRLYPQSDLSITPAPLIGAARNNSWSAFR